MKRSIILLLLLATGTAAGAAEPDNRMCNLQGREIALRISEEVSGDITAAGRDEIARIAEQVCRDYAGGGATQGGGLPVVARPAESSPAEAVAPVEAAAEPVEESLPEDEEDDGLFSFRIIDPEDRVQRPGLKRR